MRELLNNPTSIIYYLCHTVVFLIGLVLVTLIDGDYGLFFDAIGTSLVAASIAGIVIYNYIRFADGIRLKLQMLLTLGLHQAFDMRGLKKSNEYKTRLLSAEKNIDILGYGLKTFLEEHEKDLSSWKEKCKVRILLINPEYPKDNPYCIQRDLEEQKNPGTIRNEVKHFISKTKALIGKSKHGSFDVKLYNVLPSITIFRIDDEILWGPYFVGTLSRDTPMFIVKKGGRLYDQLLQQFEAIWNDEKLSLQVDKQ